MKEMLGMSKYEAFTDEELIRKFQKGEKEIMDFLMEKYKNLINTCNSDMMKVMLYMRLGSQ